MDNGSKNYFMFSREYKGKKFCYHIKDEANDRFFTDEAGNVLTYILFTEAKDFVKNLYTKKKGDI